MAPKKKGNRKGDDDWEAELGEVIDPTAAATAAAKEEEIDKERQRDDLDDSPGGGGLMAAIKKNKSKKQKKGKPTEDIVQGEDPSAAATNETNGDVFAEKDIDLSAKAPEEADMEDDVFALPVKKGKPSKQGSKQQQRQGPGGKGEELDEEDEGEGKLKSKKEKEKEKKEREKQRKKEQVNMI